MMGYYTTKSSSLSLNIYKLGNRLSSEGISNMVECHLAMQTDLLRDENIIIETDLLDEGSCLRQQPPQQKEDNDKNNNTRRISKIRPSIWCKVPFSKHNKNNSLYFPLPTRCDGCDDKFFTFRSFEFQFSSDGKCSIPIVFKMHEGIPLDTELILRIEMLIDNDILLKGQTMIPFQRNKYSLLSEKEKEKETQELLQTLRVQLQVVMSSIKSRPSQSPQLKSIKRKARLVLTEVSKHISKKRVITRKSSKKTITTQQQQ